MDDTDYKIMSLNKTQQEQGKLTFFHSSAFFFLFFILGLINNLGY